MIAGIGLDAVEIARVSAQKLGERVYSPQELAYIAAAGATAAESAAGIFAAKEAALKALGTGIGPLALRDVTVAHEPGGRPKLELSQKAATVMASLGGRRAHRTITHTKELALAQVMIED